MTIKYVGSDFKPWTMVRSVPLLVARNCDAIMGCPDRSRASVVLGPSEDADDGPNRNALAGCVATVPPAAADTSRQLRSVRRSNAKEASSLTLVSSSNKCSTCDDPCLLEADDKSHSDLAAEAKAAAGSDKSVAEAARNVNNHRIWRRGQQAVRQSETENGEKQCEKYMLASVVISRSRVHACSLTYPT